MSKRAVFGMGLACALVAGGCGPSSSKDAGAKPSVGEMADALNGVAGASPNAEIDGVDPNSPKSGGQDKLVQELLDKLAVTENKAEAANLEEEVWDAWMLSGSPTVDILMRRGVEAVELDDLEMARDRFDRAVEIKPDYAEAWNRRALLFFNDGHYDEAIADIEKALSHEPRHFGAWIGLGMIFESMERPKAALVAYRKALAIHPHAGAAESGEARLMRVVEGRSL